MATHNDDHDTGLTGPEAAAADAPGAAFASGQQADVQVATQHKEQDGPAIGSPNAAPNEMGAVIARIIGELHSADVSHVKALAAMQARLAALGAEAQIVRVNVPESYAAAVDRIKEGLAMLSTRIGETSSDLLKPHDMGVFAAADDVQPTFNALHEDISASQTTSMTDGVDFATASDLTTPAAPANIDPFDMVGASDGDDLDPWDEESAEALARVYENDGVGFTGAVPDPDNAGHTTTAATNQHHATSQTSGSTPVFFKAEPAAELNPAAMTEPQWLEARFSELSERIAKTVAASGSSAAVEALSARFDQLEARFSEALEDLATRDDLSGLKIVEAHIDDIHSQLETAQVKFDRIDTIEEHLKAFADRYNDDSAKHQGEASMPTSDILQSLAEAAATAAAVKAAGEFAQSTADARKAADADDPRFSQLQSALATYMDERRQGEMQSQTMLETMQEAMIRVLDRVDEMEVAAHTTHSASSTDSGFLGAHSILDDTPFDDAAGLASSVDDGAGVPRDRAPVAFAASIPGPHTGRSVSAFDMIDDGLFDDAPSPAVNTVEASEGPYRAHDTDASIEPFEDDDFAAAVAPARHETSSFESGSYEPLDAFDAEHEASGFDDRHADDGFDDDGLHHQDLHELDDYAAPVAETRHADFNDDFRPDLAEPPAPNLPTDAIGRIRQDFIADAQRAKLRAAADAMEGTDKPKSMLGSLRLGRKKDAAVAAPAASDPVAATDEVDGLAAEPEEAPKKERSLFSAAKRKLMISAVALAIGVPLAMQMLPTGDRLGDHLMLGAGDATQSIEQAHYQPTAAVIDPGALTTGGLQHPATTALPTTVSAALPTTGSAALPTTGSAALPTTGSAALPTTATIIDREMTPEEAAIALRASAPEGVYVANVNHPVSADVLERIAERRRQAELSAELGKYAVSAAPALVVADVPEAQPIAIDPADLTGKQSAPRTPLLEGGANRALNMPSIHVGPTSLRLAAAKGNASAQFQVAARLAEGKGLDQDFAEAAKWYARSAAQGFAQSQYRLGTLYERGLGVAKDPARAGVWYGKAAEQGNIKAMHNLAVLATNKPGQSPDYATAAQWFEKAAEFGLADSQYNLAVLYENGLGVRKDLKRAYKWYSLAGRGGDPEASKRRDVIIGKLLTDDLAEAESDVRRFSAKRSDRLVNDAAVAGNHWKQSASGAYLR